MTTEAKEQNSLGYRLKLAGARWLERQIDEANKLSEAKVSPNSRPLLGRRSLVFGGLGTALGIAYFTLRQQQLAPTNSSLPRVVPIPPTLRRPESSLSIDDKIVRGNSYERVDKYYFINKTPGLELAVSQTGIRRIANLPELQTPPDYPIVLVFIPQTDQEDVPTSPLAKAIQREAAQIMAVNNPTPGEYQLTVHIIKDTLSRAIRNTSPGTDLKQELSRLLSLAFATDLKSDAQQPYKPKTSTQDLALTQETQALVASNLPIRVTKIDNSLIDQARQSMDREEQQISRHESTVVLQGEAEAQIDGETFYNGVEGLTISLDTKLLKQLNLAGNTSAPSGKTSVTVFLPTTIGEDYPVVFQDFLRHTWPELRARHFSADDSPHINVIPVYQIIKDKQVTQLMPKLLPHTQLEIANGLARYYAQGRAKWLGRLLPGGAIPPAIPAFMPLSVSWLLVERAHAQPVENLLRKGDSAVVEESIIVNDVAGLTLNVSASTIKDQNRHPDITVHVPLPYRLIIAFKEVSHQPEDIARAALEVRERLTPGLVEKHYPGQKIEPHVVIIPVGALLEGTSSTHPNRDDHRRYAYMHENLALFWAAGRRGLREQTKGMERELLSYGSWPFTVYRLEQKLIEKYRR